MSRFCPSPRSVAVTSPDLPKLLQVDALRFQDSMLTTLRAHRRHAGNFFREGREQLRWGQLPDALNKASEAVRLFPSDAEYCALVDDILLASPDPASLVPTPLHSLTAEHAPIRARILAIQGEFIQASNLIGRVVAAAPDCGYLVWVRDWLGAPLVRTLRRRELVELLASIAKLGVALPAALPADDPRMGNVIAALEILKTVRLEHGKDALTSLTEELLIERLGVGPRR